MSMPNCCVLCKYFRELAKRFPVFLSFGNIVVGWRSKQPFPFRLRLRQKDEIMLQNFAGLISEFLRCSIQCLPPLPLRRFLVVFKDSLSPDSS